MIGSMMTDMENRTARRPAEETRPSPAPRHSEPPSTRADEDDVAQLAGALRAAERAYRGYLAELRQGDVEPVEDWSTWYAEYLLGRR